MSRRNNEEGRTVFSVKVNNLTENVKSDDLRDAFDKWGRVSDVYIPRDFNTQRNRGFAFVRYGSQEEADDAVSRSEGLTINGQDVRVEHAMRRRSPSRRRKPRYDSRSRGRHYRSRSRSRSPPRRRRGRSDSRR
eukprot:GEMP01095855.1.p2 GENE.GEMP01095855.1~~GEMP01095855.1.p2  ORF type:complete len:134 (+),score=29.02 GEMP01095855.1:38-439(+)